MRARAQAAREWALLLVATQMLTRVPVHPPFDAEAPRAAVRYVPLVGIGVGLVAWAVFALARLGLPAGVAAVLSLAATMLLTGALHEDGVADCADGLLGGRTREDALRIMRDSRVGAFGVLGVGTVLALKVGAVATLEGGMALVAGHGAGRFWAALPPAFMPYARGDGVADGMAGGMAGGVAGPTRGTLAVAAAFGLGPLLWLGWRGPLASSLVALVLSGAVAAGFGWWARRRLGGYTGDVLGATQVLTELAVLLALVWQWHAA